MARDVPDAAPGQPTDHQGLVFAQPWEASAFAIAVKLSEAGHFTWPEWVECLAATIARHEAGHRSGHDQVHDHQEEAGRQYYHQWFEALETMLKAKGIVDQAALDGRHRHLKDNPVPHDHVARRTPVAIA